MFLIFIQFCYYLDEKINLLDKKYHFNRSGDNSVLSSHKHSNISSLFLNLSSGKCIFMEPGKKPLSDVLDMDFPFLLA